MDGKKEVQEEISNMYTAVLTAGIVLSMGCLKLSPAMASLFEQWRAWVFVILNLILLSIFFTSARSSTRKNEDCKDGHVSTFKIQQDRRRKRVILDLVETKQVNHCSIKSIKTEVETEVKRVPVQLQCAEEHNLFGEITAEDGTDPTGLSNEELNERVEAFIAMFKQHLVLDARECRDRTSGRAVSKPTQSDILKSCEDSYSNVNISSKEVACSV